MDVMSSPWKTATDSPSRQLLWELNQLAISSREAFNRQLDRENEERAALHRQALEAASAQHDRVRRSAEQFRQRLEEQIQAERRRREEETQREIDRLRKEKVEHEAAQQMRAEEQRRTADSEEKRASEARRTQREAEEKNAMDRRRQDTERQQRQQHEQAAETKRREAAQAVESRRKSEAQAAEAKAREAAKATQQASTVPTTQPLSKPSTTQPVNQNPEREAEHQRYLAIHKSLKELRKDMTLQAKTDPGLKQAMGDMRRGIKKCVGQLREGKGTNKTQLQTIINTLKTAAAVPEPSVDIPTYIFAQPPNITETKGPALLVYLLNIFSKAIISQFIDEAGVRPQIADPVGTIASHIFALGTFRWKDITLIDILIAKFHVVCPALFGIYGDEKSVAGRQRLGWARNDKDGPFVPEQRHFERMTGLGAGYAGISLKNYEKAVAKNPYPDHHYWAALARLVNVPPNEITQTHFVLLKGMIDGYEAKFLHLFGDAAIAALRLALIELPRRSPPSVASKALAGLVGVLKRDQKLVL